MMEYWALVLILGLFHTPSVVHTVSDTNGKETTEDRLKQMEEKMEKIETLLYKVLIATESIQNHGNGTCLPTEYFERTGECINLGDIMCTSIDLLANKAVCYECVSCSDNTVVSCKHYGNLTKPILVPRIQVKIPDTSVDSSILEFEIEKIEKDFIVEVTGCNKCVKSQYNYTHIFKEELVQAYAEHPLRCECDSFKYTDLYCREWDTHSCYVRTPECSWNETALYCNVSKYGESKTVTYVDVTISGLKAECQRWEEVSGCDVSVTFDDNSLDHIHNKEDLKWTDDLMINVICRRDDLEPCNASFPIMCNKTYSMEGCEIIELTTGPPETTEKANSETKNSDNGGGEQDKKGTSTTLLIVIIIILLLLLLLYVGYQNHQKISSCINGTEGEAGPPPSSNRRGRMKGKYAPLPRSMEETFPRHDD